MLRGARDVHGLLIAALTALVRAIRPTRASEGLLLCTKCTHPVQTCREELVTCMGC